MAQSHQHYNNVLATTTTHSSQLHAHTVIDDVIMITVLALVAMTFAYAYIK